MQRGVGVPVPPCNGARIKRNIGTAFRGITSSFDTKMMKHCLSISWKLLGHASPQQDEHSTAAVGKMRWNTWEDVLAEG